MAGPAYQFDRKATHGRNPTAWPEYYDNVPLFYEWTRDYIKEFRLDASRTEVAEINDVLASFDLQNPMDVEFGPDGSLYVLNYGNGFFGQNQPGAELVRIDYLGATRGQTGNFAPTVSIEADTTNGLAPLTVSFTSDVSDRENQRLRYEWDFNADGKVDSRAPNPTYTFTENGVFNATLKVTDQGGRSGTDYVTIIVGNTPPVVEFVTPQDGDTFAFGDAVPFEVSVTDDQPVDCSRVQVTYILGHDTHGHPLTTAFGCTGTIQTTSGGHDPGAEPQRRLRRRVHRRPRRRPAAALGQRRGGARADRLAMLCGGAAAAAPPRRARGRHVRSARSAGWSGGCCGPTAAPGPRSTDVSSHRSPVCHGADIPHQAANTPAWADRRPRGPTLHLPWQWPQRRES